MRHLLLLCMFPDSATERRMRNSFRDFFDQVVWTLLNGVADFWNRHLFISDALQSAFWSLQFKLVFDWTINRNSHLAYSFSNLMTALSIDFSILRNIVSAKCTSLSYQFKAVRLVISHQLSPVNDQLKLVRNQLICSKTQLPATTGNRHKKIKNMVNPFLTN